MNKDWFKLLIDDCSAIMVESSFTSRWAVVEGYHALGERICKENDNFKRENIYGKKIATHVAESLEKSPRTIYRAIQFYKKYPDLAKLPLGKNASWHLICQKYLPVPKEKHECEHDFEEFRICRLCHIKLPIKLPIDKG